MKIICPSCGTDCTQTGVYERRQDTNFEFYHFKDGKWQFIDNTYGDGEGFGFYCKACDGELTHQQDELIDNNR